MTEMESIKSQEESVLSRSIVQLEKEIFSLEEITEYLINRLDIFCNNNQLIEEKEENKKGSDKLHSPFITTQLQSKIGNINNIKRKLIDFSKRLEI